MDQRWSWRRLGHDLILFCFVFVRPGPTLTEIYIHAYMRVRWKAMHQLCMIHPSAASCMLGKLYFVSCSGSSETCELISAKASLLGIVAELVTDANGGARATFSSSCISLFWDARFCCCNSNEDGESIHNLNCLLMSSNDVNVTAAAGVVRNRLVRQP